LLHLLTKNFSFEKLIAIATFDRASPNGECPVIWGNVFFCHEGTKTLRFDQFGRGIWFHWLEKGCRIWTGFSSPGNDDSSG
jgi:hypothetical protein